MKDSQRQKVYDAERLAFAARPPASAMDDWAIPTLAAAQAYINEVCERQGFAPVMVVTNNGDRWAFAQRATRKITLPGGSRGSWAWSKWILIHELAHISTPSGFQAHGLEYCAEYLRLVQAELGDEAYNSLKHWFTKGGVKFEYDAKHQKKVQADFNWRVKRPGWAKGEYTTIRVVLKTGESYYVASYSRGDYYEWEPEKLAELSGLVSAGLVASVS